LWRVTGSRCSISTANSSKVPVPVTRVVSSPEASGRCTSEFWILEGRSYFVHVRPSTSTVPLSTARLTSVSTHVDEASMVCSTET
jgi:hypothetical protein